jgi:hypothetical protein
MQNTITSWTAGICAIAGLALTGCVTTYQAPTDPALSAKVDVYKGYKTGVGFGTGTSQEYSVYASDKCEAPQRLASFTWTNGEKKEKTVAANTLLRLGAFTSYFSTGSGGYWNGTAYITTTDVTQCPSYAMFTPLPGAKYKIIQNEEDGNECSLEIIDLATSQAPVDLVTGLDGTCTRLSENEAE